MPDATWVSATQISTWLDCPRKWGYKYVDRAETPQSQASLLGQDVQDAQVDPYLATGKPIDFSKPSGEVALVVLPIMPKPKSDIQLRRKFWMPSPSDKFGYFGELDVFAKDSRVVPGFEGFDKTVPLVGDLKTTGDLQWVKTKEDLKTDVQAVIYAIAMMHEEKVDCVDMVWWYVRTRKPHRAQRVHLRMFGDDAAPEFVKIDAVGQEIAAARGVVKAAAELPINIRACDKYGGCPFRGRCNLEPTVVAEYFYDYPRKQEREGLMNFLEQLKARQAANQALATEIQATHTLPNVPMIPVGGMPAAPPVIVAVPINPPETTIADEAEPVGKGRGRKAIEKAEVKSSGGAFPASELAAFFHKLADWVEGKK